MDEQDVAVALGGSMTKAELVEEVSRVSDLTKKHSEVIVDTVFRSIITALHRGEKIELRGFGSFRLRRREPRKGRNPKTGDKVDVPPKKVPYFKPGKELKELINQEPGGTPPRPDWVVAGQATGYQLPATSYHFMDRLWAPWRLSYVTAAQVPATDCIFCDPSAGRDIDLVVLRGRHAYVILNLYPYNNGHLMVVPIRHLAALEALTLGRTGGADAAGAPLGDGAERGVSAARHQRRHQPRQGGRRRHRESSAHPSGAALVGRYELHDGCG